jgi:hypothetical protein
MRRSTLDEPITKGHDKDTRDVRPNNFGQISRWIREKPAFSDEIARLFR